VPSGGVGGAGDPIVLRRPFCGLLGAAARSFTHATRALVFPAHTPRRADA